MSVVNVLTLILLSVSSILSRKEWGYLGKYGKSTWGEVAPLCEYGMAQSPIDLTIDGSEYVRSSSIGLRQEELDPKDNNRPSTRLNRKDTDHAGMYLFNNGHSVQVNIHEDITIEGGGLEAKFKVAQLHFHWGQESDRGSEHQRYGKPFPMEMHIVAFDSSRFESLSDSVGKKDSLAVISVFFRIGRFDNPHLDPIINNIEKVHVADPNHKVKIPLFTVENLLPTNRDNYYRYHGSLTTPGCQESVIWTIMDMPNYISEHQLNHYRRLLQHTGDYLADNYRNVQNINNREIDRSFPNKIDYIVIEEGKTRQSAGVVINNSFTLIVISVVTYILYL